MPKCPGCESENVERVRCSVGAAPEGGNFAAATYRCRDCGNMCSDRDLKGERDNPKTSNPKTRSEV